MRGLNCWSILLIAGLLFTGIGSGYSGVIDLGTLGGPERNGVAFAINDRGEAAGYTDKPDGIIHAFLYSNG